VLLLALPAIAAFPWKHEADFGEVPEMGKRWTRRPEGSNWGEFGEDDQLGSLNYITPDCVLRAVGEVRKGLSFCLSLPLDYPGGNGLVPHRVPPVLRPTQRKGAPYFNFSFSNIDQAYCDIGCDDSVTLCTQYSTQWDGLAHIGAAFDLDGSGTPVACFYNGFRAGEEILAPDERKDGLAMPLGVDRYAEKAIQSRGVLIDLDHHLGRDKQTVGLAALRQAMEHDGVTVEPGDILCIHTGYADELLKMKGTPDPHRLHNMCAALDGSDEALTAWLSETRIAALAADNFAVERHDPAAPPHGPHLLPLHHHCLFKRGIPLGELWLLTPLAHWLRANRRSTFLLTAPPLRLPGAIGSPVTPVATV
jgi:kynurenine formamidase